MLCGTFGGGGEGACRILRLKGLWAAMKSHFPLVWMSVDKETIHPGLKVEVAHGSLLWEELASLIVEGHLHHHHRRLLPCHVVAAHHIRPYKLLRRTCQPTEEDDRKRRVGSLLQNKVVEALGVVAGDRRTGRLHFRCMLPLEVDHQVYLLRNQEANHKHQEEVGRMDSHRVEGVRHHENHRELANDLHQERRLGEAWHHHRWYSAKVGLEDDKLDRGLDPPRA